MRIPADSICPEMLLLLRLVSMEEPGRAAVNDNAGTESFSWEKFIEMTKENGVRPLVFCRMSALSFPGVPADKVAEMKQLIRENQIRSMEMVAVLSRVMREITKRGLLCAAIKGPALAEVNHDDPALRSYVDLDLITTESDFSAIYALLVKEKFRPMMKMNARQLKAWSSQGREFTFFRKNCCIDLHMRLTEGPGSFRSESFFEKQVTAVNVYGKLIPAFKIEALLIVLALHGAKHGWDSLKMVVDFAFLAGNKAKIDWPEVWRVAASLYCTRALALSLLLGKKICGLKISDTLVQKNRSVFEQMEIDAAFFCRRLQKNRGVLKKSGRLKFMLKSLDNTNARIRYIMYYFVSPKFTDWKNLKLPAHGAFLYLIARPVLVLLRTVRNAFKGRQRKKTDSTREISNK